MPERLGNQTTGNIGLFYVCYQLSRRGWNVMPTARNARGIDVLIYSQNGSEKLSIQVKALSRRSPVPLGKQLDHLFADYWIVCRNVTDEPPDCFVLTPTEIQRLALAAKKQAASAIGYNPVTTNTNNSENGGIASMARTDIA